MKYVLIVILSFYTFAFSVDNQESDSSNDEIIAFSKVLSNGEKYTAEI